MGKESSQSPLLRRIILMRIAFVMLLIGNGIALFTSLASTFGEINQHLGEEEFQFFVQIRTLSNTLTTISMVLAIVSSILLLFSLLRIGQKGSFKLQSTSKIAFILLLVSLILNFAFKYVLMSLELWGILDSAGIQSLNDYSPLITIGVDSAFYIFLGFTIRQLKNDYKIDNKPLITTFVYPITFALRLLLLFDIFPSEIAKLIATLVITLLGLVILIVFFGSALFGLKMVKNEIRGIKKSKILPSRRDGNFCANCGSKIERYASFCANCGHSIE